MSSWTLFRSLVSSEASLEEPSERTIPETGAETHSVADDEVMRRIQSGEKQALGLLYDRYARLVLSVGLRILHDSSEAQELVQEVFLYVFRKSQDFDPEKSPLRTWLVQIAYSRGFNKREYLSLRRFYDYRHIDEVFDAVADDSSPERSRQTSEQREVLLEAMAELTHAQRATLQMFFWEGYSLREISTHRQESFGNTRNHYYRGLEKLRETIKCSLGQPQPNGGKGRVQI